LARHGLVLTNFKGLSEVLSLNDENARTLTLSVIIKSADIAHGAKELPLHKKWSRRILEEFYLQGEKEKEFGLPVSQLCNKAEKVAKSQHGFLNFLVMPLFTAFDHKFFTDTMKKTVTAFLKENIAYWEEEIKNEVNLLEIS
jgi:hypothetical protein